MTAVPLLLVWAGMWVSLTFVGWWLSALLAIPAAGLLVRMFMIQHDCGHDAFFPSRSANDWVGRTIGVLTLTPYHAWRRAHAIHHANSGNLAKRGVGDIPTLTVTEYLERGWWGRLGYRLTRNPAVLLLLGPAFVFLIQYRVPHSRILGERAPWVSAMTTNLAIAVLAGGFMWLIGIGPFLAIYLPVVLLAGSIGVWLFYVQHQFEETSWLDTEEWSHGEAALRGSSHYDLPGVLRWLTANIGVHHVHHLASRIPFYRLPEVLRDHPELRDVGRLTLRESLSCVTLALWDERRRRLISFRQLRRDLRQGSALPQAA